MFKLIPAKEVTQIVNFNQDRKSAPVYIGFATYREAMDLCCRLKLIRNGGGSQINIEVAYTGWEKNAATESYAKYILTLPAVGDFDGFGSFHTQEEHKQEQADFAPRNYDEPEPESTLKISAEMNGAYTQVRVITPIGDSEKTFSITFYHDTVHSIGCFYSGHESALFSPAELDNAIILAKNYTAWKMIRPGKYTRGSFTIIRIQYSDMTTRAGCFKTGWEVHRNGKRWSGKCPLRTLSDAKYLCEGCI